MTQAQAADWWTGNGQNDVGRVSTHESRYVNAGTPCECDHEGVQEKKPPRRREYYHQGSVQGLGRSV